MTHGKHKFSNASGKPDYWRLALGLALLVGIFNGNLYVSKGSGGNGDDGIFQVENGTAAGLPVGGTTNATVQLIGNLTAAVSVSYC